MLDEKRMNRVLEKLDTDQMLITDPFAIYYLTGRWIFAGERFLGLLIKGYISKMVNSRNRINEKIIFLHVNNTEEICDLMHSFFD